MKEYIRAIVATSMCFVLILAMAGSAFAVTNEDANHVNFVKEAQYALLDSGVPEDSLNLLDDNIISSIYSQAKAYNFTCEQICKMVEGQRKLKTGEIVINHYEGSHDANGNLDTPYGKVFDRYNGKGIQEIASSSAQNVNGLSYYSGNYHSYINSSDQSGVFWVVKGSSGYTKCTTFATLPTITLGSNSSKDRPYMFLAANAYNSSGQTSLVGDYGVVYIPSGGYWLPFTNTGQWSNSLGAYNMTWHNGTPIPSSVTKVYLWITVTNTSTTDSIYLQVLDGDDFSNVLYTETVSFSGNPIGTNCSNLNIYRETTMAQLDATTVGLNTSTGTIASHFSYDLSYLYIGDTPYLWQSARTDDAYRQGPSSTAYSKVTVNSYTKWYKDDVTISFN